MEVVFYTENEIFADDAVCTACEQITRQAQNEGYLNTMMFAGDFGTFVAFDDDDDICGYLAVSTWCTPELNSYWAEDETAYIEQVVVSTEARGQGVASALYETLEATGWFFRLMCSVHEGNEVSLAVHEALGFQVACENEDYLVLIKYLPSKIC